MVKLKQNLHRLFADCKKTLVFAAACLALLGTVAGVILCNLTVVTVQDSENSKTIISLSKNQEKLVQRAGFVVEENDTVHYTGFPGLYANITIKRSFTVPVTVDGTTVTARMQQGTVEDCLEAAGVVLGENDYTEPSLNTPVDKNSTVRVYRVEYKDTQTEEVIPCGVQYKESSLTYRFKRREYLLSEGSDGKNLITHRERYVDGELESSLVTKVETVREPVDRQVLRYANKAVSPLEAPAGVTVTNGVPSTYRQVFTNVSCTGYSASRGRGASGLGLYCGTVAVNPDIIPYGSKLYIASPDGQFVYGWAIATDTGTGVKDGTTFVDLFYDTYKEASLNWKNVVNVYVVE